MSKIQLKSYTGGNLLFFLSYICCFVANFIPMTMFNEYFSNTTLYGISVLGIFFSLLKIFLNDRFTRKELIWSFGVFIILLLNLFVSHNIEIFVIYVLMLGARNIENTKIIKIAFICTIIGIICVVFFSLIGVIPDLVYTRTVSWQVTLRHSLGTIYPNVLGSYIFFLVLEYVFISRHMFIIKLILIAFVNYVLFELTDNRLVFFLILFFLFCYIVFTVFNLKNAKIPKLLKWFWIFLVCSVPIIFLLIVYRLEGTSLYLVTNKILSDRLSLSVEGTHLYPINLIGRNIEMLGLGGGRIFSYGEKYFYLDSLPILILLSRGLVIFVLYLLFNAFYLKRCIERKDILLAIIVSIIVLYDFADNKSVKVSFNPFILLFFNEIKNKRFEYQSTID